MTVLSSSGISESMLHPLLPYLLNNNTVKGIATDATADCSTDATAATTMSADTTPTPYYLFHRGQYYNPSPNSARYNGRSNNYNSRGNDVTTSATTVNTATSSVTS